LRDGYALLANATLVTQNYHAWFQGNDLADELSTSLVPGHSNSATDCHGATLFRPKTFWQPEHGHSNQERAH
jgi:hypothetical protein